MMHKILAVVSTLAALVLANKLEVTPEEEC